MLGSAVIDTALGLVFILFVVSTICSSTFSFISRMLELRGKLLHQGLLHLLDEDVHKKLMDHPLVESISLTSNRRIDRFLRSINRLSGCEAETANRASQLANKRCPSWIPPEIFSQAMLDIILEAARQRSLDDIFDELQQVGVEVLSTSVRDEVRIKLNSMLNKSEDDVKGVVQDVMDEISALDFVHVEDREAVMKAVDTILAQRDSVFKQVEAGIQALNLPELTTDFLRRHLDFLTNRRGGIIRTTEVQERLQEFNKTVESWFNNSMDNLTSIFKARVQVWMAGIALVVTLFFNLNLLVIAETLWTTPTVRDAVVQSAEAAAASDETPIDTEENPVEIFNEELAALDLPVGWTDQELDAAGLGFIGWAQVTDTNRPVPGTFTNLMGWLLTAGAAMFGAPFWFDVLNKIVNMRTGK